jgi:hypothetical protein
VYPSVSKTADFARSQANQVRERFNTLLEEQPLILGTVALAVADAIARTLEMGLWIFIAPHSAAEQRSQLTSQHKEGVFYHSRAGLGLWTFSDAETLDPYRVA